ncbi:hypothetical protein [Siphonobacter sp. SORGH_AS_0500]|uniref:hypothetical protein n=1 Tax=Siphonobacter sp. SORGH_AS_0500 TaxID=1864824 RepID=UPI00285D010B|nr:hypothetical protein [Siphonobacter sp. SORGH_AS_0500]MDR6196561.1 hypothetical protein [Siphonobacter sp. SORGH_AS_0500]
MTGGEATPKYFSSTDTSFFAGIIRLTLHIHLRSHSALAERLRENHQTSSNVIKR